MLVFVCFRITFAALLKLSALGSDIPIYLNFPSLRNSSKIVYVSSMGLQELSPNKS